MIGLTEALGHATYWFIIVLMMIGLYIVIARDNLVKKVMGINVFQAAAILLYVAMGKVEGGTAPILIAHGDDDHGASDHAAEVGHAAELLYSNPLPHVLMLTAIVVGVATTALALALVVRIQQEYGTTEEDEIAKIELADDVAAQRAAAGVAE